MNSTLCQTSSSQIISPHHTSVLKVAAVTIYVGKVHLGKEFGLERITHNCLSHFCWQMVLENNICQDAVA